MEQRVGEIILTEKLKLLIIILVVIAVIAIVGYFFPMVYLFLLVGYGIFVLGTLVKSWEHPKWYVKLYTGFVAVWEFFFVWACAWGPLFGATFVLVLITGVTLPLIPLWFLWYKKM